MIRRITPSDKPRVLEICSQIWEGSDYIPQVFDEWVRDEGLFAGLWENDVLVGLGKLAFITPKEVWLEGLRKDEKSGASGVGAKISKFYFDFLKGKNIEMIRFATYFSNIASIRLNEKLGFKKILELSYKSKKIIPFTRMIPSVFSQDIDFASLRTFVEKSCYLRDVDFNLSQGWIFHKYSPEELLEYYKKKHFVVWLEYGKITGCALWSEIIYQDVFWLSLLEVKDENMFTEFMNYFYFMNANSQYTKIEMLFPDGQLLEFGRNHDFISEEREHDFRLYELPKDKIEEITGQKC